MKASVKSLIFLPAQLPVWNVLRGPFLLPQDVCTSAGQGETPPS